MYIKSTKNDIIRIIPTIFSIDNLKLGIITNTEEIIKPRIILYIKDVFLFNKNDKSFKKIIKPTILPIINGKYKLKFLIIKKGFVIITIIFSNIPKLTRKKELLTPGNTFPKENSIPPSKYLKKENDLTLLLLLIKSNNRDNKNEMSIGHIHILDFIWIFLTKKGISLSIIPDKE